MRSDGRAGGIRDDDTTHDNEMNYDMEQRSSHNLIPVRTPRIEYWGVRLSTSSYLHLGLLGSLLLLVVLPVATQRTSDFPCSLYRLPLYSLSLLLAK